MATGSSSDGVIKSSVVWSMDLHITKIKLNNVHIINEFSKHTIFTLHPYRSLKQQDCSLRL